MNNIRFFVWFVCVALPLVCLIVVHQYGTDKDFESKTDNALPSRPSKPGRNLPAVSQRDTQNDFDFEYLRNLLYRNGQLVSVEEFDQRLQKRQKGLDPSSKNYQFLLHSAYLNALLRYDAASDQPANFTAIADLLARHPFSPAAYLAKAVKVYGFSAASTLVSGGIQNLSGEEISSVVRELEGSLGEFVQALTSSGKSIPELGEGALGALFLAPEEHLSTSLKWQLLATISDTDNRSSAIAALATHFATHLSGNELPEVPLTNPQDIHRFHSAIAIALSQNDLSRGIAFLTTNPSLLNQEMTKHLWRQAGQMGEDNLSALRELIASTKDPKLKEALKHGEYKAWAAFAPQQAAQSAFDGLKNGTTSPAHLTTAVQDWFRFAPVEALNFVKSSDLNVSSKHGLLESYLPEISRSAPDQYRDYRKTISEQDTDLSDNNIIAADLNVSEDYALDRIDEITNKEDRFRGYFKAADQIAANDLKGAVQHAAATPDPDKRDALLLGSLAAAMNTDLQLAQRLIEQVSDYDHQTNAFRSWLSQAEQREPSLSTSFLDSIKKSDPQLYQTLNSQNQ